MEKTRTLSGSRVRFALGKVVCPDPEEVPRQIDTELEIEGLVEFLSDYGKVESHFAIVRVKGIHVPLIVPVKKLEVIETNLENLTDSLTDGCNPVG